MIRSALALAIISAPAFADVSLQFPAEAIQSFNEQKAFESYKMPVGSALVQPIKRVVAEGAFTQTVWQTSVQGSTTLRIMDDLRQQLEGSGFEVLYECETQVCGGFDFRFATRVVPEPAMHVDLGDFRYLAVQRLGQSVPEYLSLLVSRSGDQAYVQMIHIGPQDAVIDVTEPADPSNVSIGDLADLLDTNGVAVLSDLVFPTGSSELGEGDFASLSDLATYLGDHPDRAIILVGHTDAEGSLDGNVNLSRLRARSVADRLIEEFDVNSSQVSADGVGFLAPRASNLTEEGRTKNRRVEAVLASTQ